jgi:hypothetical protein
VYRSRRITRRLVRVWYTYRAIRCRRAHALEGRSRRPERERERERGGGGGGGGGGEEGVAEEWGEVE